MRVCDLFAGLGGFTCGALEAGASVVLAVDSDPILLKLLGTNAPQTTTVVATLGKDEVDLPPAAPDLHVHQENIKQISALEAVSAAHAAKRVELAARMAVTPNPGFSTILGTDVVEISQKEIERRRKERMDRRPVPGASTPLRRAATKRSRAPRTSDTDLMETAAEQLWSGKTRGLLEFERIAPTNGLPMGAIGVAVGPKGGAAFWPYLKQPKVIARLEAEGFERAGQGAPYPWCLPWKPGVVSPSEKALCRALTDEQRARCEANRIAALERGRRQRVEKDVAALHGELSDDATIAALDEAVAAHDSEKS